jgi:hypothetical protein
MRAKHAEQAPGRIGPPQMRANSSPTHANKTDPLAVRWTLSRRNEDSASGLAMDPTVDLCLNDGCSPTLSERIGPVLSRCACGSDG